MIDPVAATARAAASILAAELGASARVEVEAALLARDSSPQRPTQYVDPVSLGGLIVAIATLAWTIYADRSKRSHHSSSDASTPPGEIPEAASPYLVARQVRTIMRERGEPARPHIDRITDTVVTEVFRFAANPNVPVQDEQDPLSGGATEHSPAPPRDLPTKTGGETSCGHLPGRRASRRRPTTAIHLQHSATWSGYESSHEVGAAHISFANLRFAPSAVCGRHTSGNWASSSTASSPGQCWSLTSH
jgi:hypothetical protein